MKVQLMKVYQQHCSTARVLKSKQAVRLVYFTMLSFIIIFLLLFPFHLTEIQQSLSFKQPLVLLSLFCKTVKFSLHLMILLTMYFCHIIVTQDFQTWLFYFGCPDHVHRSSFQEHLKIVDLKSGTMYLWQLTAAQPCLNIFGCDLLGWVGLNCDGEIKVIQSLSLNSSMTEAEPYA